jgi:hypothetical protein
LAATATVGEVKNYIREVIEEKKKKIRKPEILNQAYVNRILAELEILQMLMAEIYNIGRRKDLAKQYPDAKQQQEHKSRNNTKGSQNDHLCTKCQTEIEEEEAEDLLRFQQKSENKSSS